MNPSKPAPGITFNTTESMAEWAWRYGETAFPHQKIGRLALFDDGSTLFVNRAQTAIDRCLLVSVHLQGFLPRIGGLS